MLPKNLKYGNRLEGAPARSYRTNIAPQNGTGPYLPNTTIIINIPTRNNLILAPSETYLKFGFSAQNNGDITNSARWDNCGAHGLIQRLVVRHGSNIIEHTDNYGNLASMLYAIQLPDDAVKGKYNVFAGTRANDLYVSTPTAAAQSTLPVINVTSGDSIVGFTAMPANAVYTPVTYYCLNLVSFLGSLSNQYVPLFEMTSAPLTLELTLAPNALSSIVSFEPLTTFQLTDVEFVSQYIELQDEAINLIRSNQNGQPIQYVIPQYRNYQGNGQIPNGTAAVPKFTQIQIPIPCKFASVKSLFVSMRDKYLTAEYYPFSSVTNGLSSYQFRIGSQVMPSKLPDNFPEMFTELMKSIGSLSDINHQPSINLLHYQGYQDSIAYEQEDLAYTNTGSMKISPYGSGKFYIGIDLEGYAGSDKSSMFAGMNTLTDDIYVILNFSPKVADATVTPDRYVRFDTYALIDVVLVCQNGTAYIQF